MKALKITLALVAIAVLTVSGVQSDKVVAENETTFQNESHFDLLATNKKKVAKPTQQ